MTTRGIDDLPPALRAQARAAQRAAERSARGAVAVATAPVPAAARARRGMNATERAYADHLDLRVHAGLVSEWAYEPVTLKLADDTRLTPDFFVVLASGEAELHECKGRKGGKGGRETYHIEEDALVKLKVAARQFPFRLRLVWPAGPLAAGRWHAEDLRP